MNGYDWPDTDLFESDDSEDEYWPESDWFDQDWGDGDGDGEDESAEFILPALGFAAARKLAGRRRRKPRARPVVPRPARPRPARVAPGTRSELNKIYVVMKRLEKRQDAQTRQLAQLQQRASGIQAGDLFRHSLTSAATEVGPALAAGDWGGALSRLVPAAQNWRGIPPAFPTRPINTLLCPVAAAAAAHFLRKPERPSIGASKLSGIGQNDAAVITLTSPTPAAKTYYTTDGTEPTKNSTLYEGPFEVKAAGKVRARTFTGVVGSEPVEINLQG